MEKPNKLKIPLLIIALLVILGGGGFAIWSITRKEDEQPTQKQEGTQAPPVGGRNDVTNLYTEEELQHSALFNENSPDKTPEYSAVLMTSSEGLKLIEDRMIKIQLNKKDSDFIRAKHSVGRTLVNNSAFSTKANQAIAKMFGLVAGTTEGNYKTYPVYGKFETEAAPLRADIENFLSKDGQGYNLTELRHGGNAWWFGSVGLNLMYGNSNAHLHSADQIWWYKADRAGLDFYKLINGHDVDDRRLLEKRSGKGVFAAWGMYSLVKNWRDAMDFFDKVTREEAITALEREGLIRRI
jgi:hypothetical protein